MSVDIVQGLMRVGAKLGLQGNLQAARMVLDRVCGKAPNPANAAPLDIDLPNLVTAEACAIAIDRIVAAITAGTIETATAKLLVDAVTARIKAIELNDFGERLSELEKAAESVELPRNGQRR